MKFRNLPSGWTTAPIEELIQLNPKHPPYLADDDIVSFVPMQAVDDAQGIIRPHDSRPFGDLKKGYTQFRDGDVLFAKITPCMENGKAAVARNLEGGFGCGSTEFFVLRSGGGVLPDYLHRYLRQEGYRQRARASMTSTAGQARVAKDFLLATALPVPPLNEQRRIVAKIEELTDLSRRAREALDAVPSLLDRFRQSVLAAAFRGDLTAEWRAKNPDVEPALVLLERIRHSTTALPVADALPTLPDGWSWTTLQEIAEIRGGLTKNQKRGELARRMKYLRVANVYAGELRLDDIQEIGVASDAEIERCQLEKDDILVVEGNGSPDQIGRVALWDGSIDPCLHQNHIINVRLNSKQMANFIALWLLSPAGRALIREKASTTTGLYTLSLSKVGSLPVPVAPIEEQTRVVDIAEAALGNWQGLNTLVETTSDRLAAMEQSILAKAFRGELVPQDTNDEPAAVLLERIRGERAEAVVPKAKRGRKPRGMSEAKA